MSCLVPGPGAQRGGPSWVTEEEAVSSPTALSRSPMTSPPIWDQHCMHPHDGIAAGGSRALRQSRVPLIHIGVTWQRRFTSTLTVSREPHHEPPSRYHLPCATLSPRRVLPPSAIPHALLRRPPRPHRICTGNLSLPPCDVHPPSAHTRACSIGLIR